MGTDLWIAGEDPQNGAVGRRSTPDPRATAGAEAGRGLERMGADKRKFERFAARLEVEIRTRGRGQICPSMDVSRHGMYLTTPNPPHERQLLILRIPVPDDQPPIDVMASVVRRHAPGDER